jgi:hypothetical protein
MCCAVYAAVPWPKPRLWALCARVSKAFSLGRRFPANPRSLRCAEGYQSYVLCGVVRPGISGAVSYVAVQFVGPEFQGLPRSTMLNRMIPCMHES